MPAKFKNERNWFDVIKDSMSNVFDNLFLGVYSSINREADYLMDKLESRAIGIQRRMIWNTASAIVIGLSLVFLLSAIYFYMIEMQGVSRTISFLVLAILLFVVGAIIRKFKGGDKYA